ncbi:YdeI/OmpD-associated family protein [Microbacterium chocolatum]|uniref:YdeI/OmpD-associated family protein n=1 Tax=Microbacterium aurantiacum TaxID=162393 RepID=UPI0033906767
MGALDDGERIHATDAASWRAWLETHHATSRGAWLVRARPGSDIVVVAYEDAIRQALCFGWIDGPVRTFDERIGGLWFAPRRPSSGWAATNKARLIELEAAGLLAPAGIRAIEVAKANGSWTILDNAEALREPDDLAVALDANAAARAAWDAFPPSSRKFGIGAVDAARRPETRAARIARIVADAADGKRPQ